MDRKCGKNWISRSLCYNVIIKDRNQIGMAKSGPTLHEPVSHHFFPKTIHRKWISHLRSNIDKKSIKCTQIRLYFPHCSQQVSSIENDVEKHEARAPRRLIQMSIKICELEFRPVNGDRLGSNKKSENTIRTEQRNWVADTRASVVDDTPKRLPRMSASRFA